MLRNVEGDCCCLTQYCSKNIAHAICSLYQWLLIPFLDGSDSFLSSRSRLSIKSTIVYDLIRMNFFSANVARKIVSAYARKITLISPGAFIQFCRDARIFRLGYDIMDLRRSGCSIPRSNFLEAGKPKHEYDASYFRLYRIAF